MHVGLTGRARTGKDTAAAALTAAGWQRVGFADLLREVAYAVDPIVSLGDAGHGRLAVVVDQVGWERAKDDYDDVRRFLQRLGTEGVRNHLGTHVWVEAAMARATTPTVFTDVRFPNEAQAIRDAGGIVIRLVRPSAGPVVGHSSEEAMDGWPVDAVVANDGTPAELHAKILGLTRTGRIT